MAREILIYGFGNMTSAMLEGWIASGLQARDFTVFNPSAKPVPDGAILTSTIPTRAFDVVVLGFKPHMLGDIAPAMQDCVGPQTLLLSVLAGVEVDDLAAAFPSAKAVLRLMPNLAVALGKSPNSLFANNIADDDKALATDLAQRLGSAEWIEDEAQFDLATALAGSGPGFVYRFIDALGAAGADLGLPAEQAQRMAVQMVAGAGALAAASEFTPEELANRVASPGGMTREGLNVLDEGEALKKLLTKTLSKTADKGSELAKLGRKQG